MQIDHDLFNFVNHDMTCAPLDWWAAIVTAQSVWGPPVLVALLALVWRSGRRVRSAFLIGAVALLIGDAVIVRSMKAIVHRARPSEAMAGVRTIHLAHVEPRVLAFARPLDVQISDPKTPPERPRSFPSGHAWNCFSVATVCAIACRRWGWLAFLPAAAVAFARVYGGVHWPSDVAAAAILAPAFTCLVVLGFEKLRSACAPRVSARLAARFPTLAT